MILAYLRTEGLCPTDAGSEHFKLFDSRAEFDLAIVVGLETNNENTLDIITVKPWVEVCEFELDSNLNMTIKKRWIVPRERK